jgi:subtilisin family serine protease
LHRSIRAAALAVAVGGLAAAPPAQAASTQQVIVKLAPGASTGLLAGVGTTLGTVPGLGARVLRVPGDPARAAARLNRLPGVLYAEPDRVLRATATPNDPRFGELYGMQRINAPAGWDTFGLGAFPNTGGTTVGIVDTGILRTHEDFAAKQIVACAATSNGLLGLIGGDPVPKDSRGCADDNGHGTHVAGTIAADASNGRGVTGVAFTSRLAICKALHGALGSGSTSGVAGCITYLADRGAKVISMSLGGGASTTLQNAVTYARNRDALLIAAAGNDGDATLNYPAAYADVVSVAATDETDTRASFSNANADVEVAAPGVDVLSTWNDGSYDAISGTSMATPHVAGVAALIRAKSPALTWQQARAKLTAATDDLGPAGRDPQYGFGLVDVVKAGS